MRLSLAKSVTLAHRDALAFWPFAPLGDDQKRDNATERLAALAEIAREMGRPVA